MKDNFMKSERKIDFTATPNDIREEIDNKNNGIYFSNKSSRNISHLII